VFFFFFREFFLQICPRQYEQKKPQPEISIFLLDKPPRGALLFVKGPAPYINEKGTDITNAKQN